MKALVIANPQSQNGALGRRWSQLAAVIGGQLDDFEHRFTRGPGDATRIAQEALERDGFEMIVAMGGDGTISEVVAGFFDDDGHARSPDTVLGVLPFGTGGDFRRTIGASKKLAEGAASLRGKAVRTIDVGRMRFADHHGRERTRHFVNIASFGLSGLVDQKVNEASKALGGFLSFAIASIKATREFAPQRARIALDHGEPREVELQTVAIANGRYFGGGMKVAPDAKLDDGQFDVVVIGGMSFGETLMSGHRIYRGRHIDLENVSVQRAAHVTAEPVGGERILLDVDGETPGVLPATFEVLPQALKLKVPQQ